MRNGRLPKYVSLYGITHRSKIFCSCPNFTVNKLSDIFSSSILWNEVNQWKLAYDHESIIIWKYLLDRPLEGFLSWLTLAMMVCTWPVLPKWLIGATVRYREARLLTITVSKIKHYQVLSYSCDSFSVYRRLTLAGKYLKFTIPGAI